MLFSLCSLQLNYFYFLVVSGYFDCRHKNIVKQVSLCYKRVLGVQSGILGFGIRSIHSLLRNFHIYFIFVL